MEYLRELSIEEVKAELSLFKGIGPKTVSSCSNYFKIRQYKNGIYSGVSIERLKV